MMDQISYQGLYAVAIISLAAYYLYVVLTRPTSHLPGPWHSKFTSAILDYYWITAKRARYVHKLHQKYGRVVRIGPEEVSVLDANAVHELYSVKETFRKAPFYTRFIASPIPNMFSTTEIDYHRRHRRMLGGPLSETSLKVWTQRVHEQVSLTIDRMEEEMKMRGAADIVKWWFFMATDIIGELTFGDSFHMLETGKLDQYAKDIMTISSMGTIRSTFPTLTKYAQYFPIPALKKVKQSVIQMNKHADASLDRYETLLQDDSSMIQQSLFAKLFKAEAEETLPRREIQANAQSYIIAGSDTVSNSLTYLVWAVCGHPEVKKKLVNELKTLPENFKETDLRDLKYLNQVIEESMRLYGAAQSGLPRSVPQSGATLAGRWIPGGTTVSVQAHSMHREPSIFTDPEKFDPSRWEEPTKEMKLALMHFSWGARACIGKHLAQMEMRLGTAIFFRRFPEAKMSTLEGMSNDDMDIAFHFVLSPRGKRCLVQEK